LVLLKLPNQKKGVSDVLVRLAKVLVNEAVDDAANLVNIHHDVLLKLVCGGCEVIDHAKPKDANNFLARQHWVDLSVLGYVFSNYF
jgi:hypothetical protein